MSEASRQISKVRDIHRHVDTRTEGFDDVVDCVRVFADKGARMIAECLRRDPREAGNRLRAEIPADSLDTLDPVALVGFLTYLDLNLDTFRSPSEALLVDDLVAASNAPGRVA